MEMPLVAFAMAIQITAYTLRRRLRGGVTCSKTVQHFCLYYLRLHRKYFSLSRCKKQKDKQQTQWM